MSVSMVVMVQTAVSLLSVASVLESHSTALSNLLVSLAFTMMVQSDWDYLA